MPHARRVHLQRDDRHPTFLGFGAIVVALLTLAIAAATASESPTKRQTAESPCPSQPVPPPSPARTPFAAVMYFQDAGDLRVGPDGSVSTSSAPSTVQYEQPIKSSRPSPGIGGPHDSKLLCSPAPSGSGNVLNQVRP